MQWEKGCPAARPLHPLWAHSSQAASHFLVQPGICALPAPLADVDSMSGLCKIRLTDLAFKTDSVNFAGKTGEGRVTSEPQPDANDLCKGLCHLNFQQGGKEATPSANKEHSARRTGNGNMVGVMVLN